MTFIFYFCLLIAGIFIMIYVCYQEIKKRLLPDVSDVADDDYKYTVDDILKEVLGSNDFNCAQEITAAPAYRKQITIADSNTEIHIALVNEVRFGPYLHSCSINDWSIGRQIEGQFIISSDGNFVAFLFTSYFSHSRKFILYAVSEQKYKRIDAKADVLVSFESNLLVYKTDNEESVIDMANIVAWESNSVN